MKKAFTLLEILLVIAAIGILAAIVIIAINPQKQLDQVRTAEAESSVNTLYKALEQYLLETGSYPNTLSNEYVEICDTGTLTSSDVVTINNCVDLRELVPRYIASVPTSPFSTNETGIFAWVHPENQRISLYSDTSEPVGTGINYSKSLVQNGLINHLDPKDSESYPGTGSTIADLSDNGYAASLNGNVTFNSNTKVFSFDGSTGFIQLNNSLRSELSASDFSISLWVNKSNREETLVGFINAANPVGDTYVFVRQSSFHNFRITNNINSGFSWDGYYDRWIQVTMTFDNSLKQMRIYFDGELQDEVLSSTTVNLNLSSSNMDIGRDGRGNSYFNGLMSEILVYDRELTAQEVKLNYISSVGLY